MTDAQLYLAIGIPSGLFALNFLTILWQARALTSRIDSLERSLNTRIDSLEKVMNARFEAAHQGLLQVEGVLDARLKHLEDRKR